MKNITNKTKTILFAGLIAAMILPFSGMTNANAEELSNEEAYNLLNDYERDILFISSLEVEDDKEKDKALKRIGLSKQLIVTQQRLDITEDETKQQKLEDKIQKILAKIDENRSSNVIEAELEEVLVIVTCFPVKASFGYLSISYFLLVRSGILLPPVILLVAKFSMDFLTLCV